MIERVAYCRKPDEPEWDEIILTECEDRIPAATAWAEAQGYIVRVAEYDLSKPPAFMCERAFTR